MMTTRGAASGEIEVHSWPTPNGHKVHVMLEECGLPYRVIAVDIGAGEQFAPDFLAISPNNKIPAIVDPAGPDGAPMPLFESGAILLYLAGKTGRFLPADVRGKYRTLEWLMFQMGGVGPMLGQAHHFRVYAPEKIAYAVERYTNEAKRLYGVMDRRLAKSTYLAGPDYTIADIAVFPWLRSWKNQGIDWNDFPHLKGWFDEIAARPAAVGQHLDAALHCRAGGDLVEPAPQVRMVVPVDALVLPRPQPRKNSDVGDRVVRPGQVGALGEPPVHHAVQTFGLVGVALDRVVDLLRRVDAEVVRLPQHRPDAAHLEHQPLQAAVARGRVRREQGAAGTAARRTARRAPPRRSAACGRRPAPRRRA